MSKTFMNKRESNELYRLLKFIHDEFIKKKIAYFMVGGTLLGAVRHQGLIPHDDDGDICIFRKDVPKLRKLVSAFAKKGYVLEEGGGANEDDPERKLCRKKKDTCTWFIYGTGNNKDTLSVDVFVMEQKRDKITYADPYWETAESGGIKCYFKREHLFPLLPYRFGNFYMYGPHNSIPHLNKCYGEDWNSKSQILYDHRRGVWVMSKKKNITDEEFLTLKAPKDTCDTKIPNIVCETSSKGVKYFKTPTKR
jgi:lipopolysaccharide cholinephosphotransferase